MKKRWIGIFLVIAVCMIVMIPFILLKEKAEETKPSDKDFSPYLEQAAVHTCSNDEDLELQLRFVSDTDMETYSVSSSDEAIETEIIDVTTMEGNGKYLYTFILNLTMPKGSSAFSLIFDINQQEYTLKNIQHENFNAPESMSGKSFVIYSPYVENGANQQFQNDITLHDAALSSDAQFGIFGEDLLNASVIGNKAILTSQNNEPAIVGYYYVQDGQKVCIANSYHTEYLEKEVGEDASGE